MIATDSSFFKWLMDMLWGLESIRTPFGDTVMSGVTLLGQEALFMAAACVIFYCVNKKSGYKFLFMFHLGQLMNQALKVIFAVPRPWEVDTSFPPVESAIEGATGWSFPSGHTQSAVMMYFGLAKETKKRFTYFIAAAVVLLVGFSRMYLGVHTLLDVVAAVVPGFAALIAADLLFGRFGSDPRFITYASAGSSVLSLALVISVMVFCKESPHYAEDLGNASTMFGLAFGLFAGSIVERRFVGFETEAPFWIQVVKVVLGLGVMIGLRIGLKALFLLITDSPLMNAMRYFLMVFVGVAVYPLSFRLLAAFGKKNNKARA